jgi:hypothetical protein
MTGKYLITTDKWFTAPDGLTYNTVWGNVQVLEDVVLGVKTNRNSTNWYAQIGGNGREIIVAGCQIHYAIRCNEKPNTEDVEEDEEYFYFYGYSGSCYQCKKGSYGFATSYSVGIVDSLKVTADKNLGEIDVLDESTDWLNLLK